MDCLVLLCVVLIVVDAHCLESRVAGKDHLLSRVNTEQYQVLALFCFLGHHLLLLDVLEVLLVQDRGRLDLLLLKQSPVQPVEKLVFLDLLKSGALLGVFVQDFLRV